MGSDAGRCPEEVSVALPKFTSQMRKTLPSSLKWGTNCQELRSWSFGCRCELQHLLEARTADAARWLELHPQHQILACSRLPSSGKRCYSSFESTSFPRVSQRELWVPSTKINWENIKMSHRLDVGGRLGFYFFGFISSNLVVP
jgi:hypothetical protein